MARYGRGGGNKSSGGFWDDVVTHVKMRSIAEASKGPNGRPNPAAAMGMAVGLGHHSFDDLMKLGVALGTEGVFDPPSSFDHSYDHDFDYSTGSANASGFDYDSQSAIEQTDTDLAHESFEPEGVSSQTSNVVDDALDDLDDPYELDDADDQELVPEEPSDGTIDPSDFPNKRTYEAASYLAHLEEFYSSAELDEYRQRCKKCCLFIRNNPDLLAAKYITYEGIFLYAQAVKEHFSLPFEVEDEDEDSKTSLNELIMDAAEFDETLALDLWVWCVHEFYAYRNFSSYPGDVVACMDNELLDCSETFVQDLISRVENDDLLCEALMTAAEECSFFATYLTSKALCSENAQAAIKLFSAYINGKYAKDKDVYGVIEGIISQCSNWEEKESLELFRDQILPIAAEYTDNARVINGIKKWTQQVDEHIDAVERSAEKYAYSGRYAWRTTCADGSAYNLDPRNHETEEEYNERLHERKYFWRRTHASLSETHGLDINAYETREEFQHALNECMAQSRKMRQKQREVERRQREEEWYKPDPLASTDKTVYPFCGVVFLNSDGVYHYRTQDTSLTIGDLVVAPVGKDNRRLVAEVVSVEQHTRRSAPFPVDKAKFIIGRYEPSEKEASPSSAPAEDQKD